MSNQVHWLDRLFIGLALKRARDRKEFRTTEEGNKYVIETNTGKIVGGLGGALNGEKVNNNETSSNVSFRPIDPHEVLKRINPDNVIAQSKQDNGRHSGKRRDAAKWKDSSLRDSMKSYQDRVDEHIDKLHNPQKYDKEWNSKTETARNGLLHKWEKDLIRNREELIIVADVAMERGLL